MQNSELLKMDYFVVPIVKFLKTQQIWAVRGCIMNSLADELSLNLKLFFNHSANNDNLNIKNPNFAYDLKQYSYWYSLYKLNTIGKTQIVYDEQIKKTDNKKKEKQLSIGVVLQKIQSDKMKNQILFKETTSLAKNFNFTKVSDLYVESKRIIEAMKNKTKQEKTVSQPENNFTNVFENVDPISFF